MNIDKFNKVSISDKKQCDNVIIIDLGLGGLNILYNLYSKLKEYCVNVVYFDLSSISKYNTKNKNSQDKEYVSIINSINKGYKSKLCIVACHTLSVIIEENRELIEPSTNIISMLDAFRYFLSSHNKLLVGKECLFFGTMKTVNSIIYNKILSQFKINYKPFYVSNLCSLIESDNFSINQIHLNIKNVCDKSISVFLLSCTHYTLIIDDLKKLLHEMMRKDIVIYDLNSFIDPILPYSLLKKEDTKGLFTINSDNCNKYKIAKMLKKLNFPLDFINQVEINSFQSRSTLR